MDFLIDNPFPQLDDPVTARIGDRMSVRPQGDMDELPTQLQLKLAKLCGINLNGASRRLAAALLQLALAEDVLGISPSRATSDPQREMAKQLDIAQLSDFMEIAALQINAVLVKRNEEALARYKFAPGMRVTFVGGAHVHDLAYSAGTELVISRVRPDGSVFFKGTTGAGAYASQLEPVV